MPAKGPPVDWPEGEPVVGPAGGRGRGSPGRGAGGRPGGPAAWPAGRFAGPCGGLLGPFFSRGPTGERASGPGLQTPGPGPGPRAPNHPGNALCRGSGKGTFTHVPCPLGSRTFPPPIPGPDAIMYSRGYGAGVDGWRGISPLSAMRSYPGMYPRRWLIHIWLARQRFTNVLIVMYATLTLGKRCRGSHE